jgi:cobalt-zinc-cadmium efflux system outer membrane protein
VNQAAQTTPANTAPASQPRPPQPTPAPPSPAAGSAREANLRTAAPVRQVSTSGAAPPETSVSRVQPARQTVGTQETETPEVGNDVPESAYARRLRLPPEIPGAQSALVHLPPYDPEHPETRARVVEKLFPDLPEMWPLALPRPTPGRPAMTLGQLQDLALQYNPTLIQARAGVTSFLGDAIQAGTHPNPMFGYESDTVGSSLTRDYQGLYFSQLVKTANKLGLARQVANVDVMNAQLMVRKTRLDVLSQVKAAYFAVLVAEENVIVSDALVRFMHEVFRVQRSRAKGPDVAGFEPAQLRGLANLAKTQLVLAQNSYIAAWKTLVTKLGLPLMPPTALRGRADMLVPAITYEAALRRMLSIHPDILIGRNMASKARYALKLEQVKPIPDVFVYGTFQKDFTNPGAHTTSYNTQLGVPVPIWDRNRGNILSAQGDLGQAQQQLRRAQMDLTAQLANTFAQYETNRYQLQMYAQHVLPDFARAFRSVYERHNSEPGQVGFEDVVLVQQNLAAMVPLYIGALNGQWSAVADLANLMQIEDFEDMGTIGGQPPQPGPEVLPPPRAEPRRPAPPARPAPPQQGGRR